MSYDFNQADEQANFDVIPAGTICELELAIRPGGTGEGGWLKQSRDGNSAMLDCEFTVMDGPHEKRTIWTNFCVSGTRDGHAKATTIKSCAQFLKVRTESGLLTKASAPRK